MKCLTRLFFILWLPTAAFCAPNFALQKRLIDHTTRSIKLADAGVSQLTQPVLDMEGFSSIKLRHLLNNLCSLKGSTYFEIGYWKAASLISAVFGNERKLLQSASVNAWLQFKTAKQELINSLQFYLKKPNLKFTEKDWKTIDFSQFLQHPITIFFHDGKSHIDAAFRALHTSFNDAFIIVINDWNWERIRLDTKKTFHSLGYTVLFEKEFSTKGFDKRGWWNGVYIAVIQK